MGSTSNRFRDWSIALFDAVLIGVALGAWTRFAPALPGALGNASGYLVNLGGPWVLAAIVSGLLGARHSPSSPKWPVAAACGVTALVSATLLYYATLVAIAPSSNAFGSERSFAAVWGALAVPVGALGGVVGYCICRHRNRFTTLALVVGVGGVTAAEAVFYLQRGSFPPPSRVLWIVAALGALLPVAVSRSRSGLAGSLVVAVGALPMSWVVGRLVLAILNFIRY